MVYALELERIAKAILDKKSKRVCVQLPDGLKPEAGKIAKELEERTGAAIFIWAGSCFGACDTPQGLEKLNIDLLVQFGHSEWR
jgi:2-(3-amino-3-carboxypropyl)histidine synthase